MANRLRSFPHRSGAFIRDWRVKTLLPFIVINIVAFAGLYALMYHFAVRNVVESHMATASSLFDELQLGFEDMMANRHASGLLESKLDRHARAHRLTSLHVYDSGARTLASTGAPPSPPELDQVRQILSSRRSDIAWYMSPTSGELVFGRAIANLRRCQTCHSSALTELGALQVGFDLTAPIAQATTGLREKFAIAGVAWIAVVGLLFWIGRIVIGRPLAQIEQSLGVATSGDEPASKDLDSLAARLHETIWGLIETQRTRDEDMKRHMARAEQLAALGELAAGLTHEIKNPLAGIIAALELLRDGRTPAADERELVDQMLAELRRVTGTLDSLLRLARPQAPRRVETDLRVIARDLVALFQPRARRHGVELHVETAQSIPTVPLDQNLMTQVLVNLLTNSIQATPRGGSVRVIVAPFPRHDGVVLAVVDTGRGIDAADVQKVFDPFFTTKEEGTGLGLAICRQIVEQHGGTMGIESEREKGTRVVVLLPRPAEMEERRDATAAG